MRLEEALENMRSGKMVPAGSQEHQYMHELAQAALKLTAQLNGSYHTPEEIREIMSRITGTKIDDSFNMFPPFHTDCGRNIRIGKNVFINSGCHFQDQGGITIGDGALIGHNVTLATINHGMQPDRRGDHYMSPVVIGTNVWIGSNSVILPGVTVGDGSIVAAGSVVTKDIPPMKVYGGTPARYIKDVEPEEE